MKVADQPEQVICNQTAAVTPNETEQVNSGCEQQVNTEDKGHTSVNSDHIVPEQKFASNGNVKDINTGELVQQSTMELTEPGSLNSSINRSHAYEKLLRKQLAGGDPELEAIVSDDSHRLPPKDQSSTSITAHEKPSQIPVSKSYSSKGKHREYAKATEKNNVTFRKDEVETKEEPRLILRLRDTSDNDEGDILRTHDTHRDHLSYSREIPRNSSRTNSAGTDRDHQYSEYQGKSKDVNSSIPANHRDGKYTEDHHFRGSSRSSSRDYSESNKVAAASSRESYTERRDKSRESSPSRRHVSPTRSSSQDAKGKSSERDRGSQIPRSYNEVLIVLVSAA